MVPGLRAQRFSYAVGAPWHDGRVTSHRIPALVFAAAAFLTLAAPGPYLLESAGPAVDVHGSYQDKQLVTIKGADTYPSDSHLFMTTVTQWGTPQVGVTGAQTVAALFSKDLQMMPVRSVYAPAQTLESAQKQDAAMMDSSQNAAAVVALQKAGYKVTMKLTVAADHGDFRKGDVLKSLTINGTTTPITTFSDLSSRLFATNAGTRVNVGVTRDGKSVDIVATTVAYEADSTGWVHPGSRLGVALIDSDLKFPVDVTYDVQGIGGPSAGTMFTLGIYDSLTKGSLAGSATLAGTGTMSYNGDVGAIGGIQHKLVGAYGKGARNFLAPAENCAETVGYTPAGMKVWSIRTIDDALAAARAIGEGKEPDLPQCGEVAQQAAQQ